MDLRKTKTYRRTSNTFHERKCFSFQDLW